MSGLPIAVSRGDGTAGDVATQWVAEPTEQGLAALLATEAYRKLSFAPATQRAYSTDWKDFMAFCAAMGFVALPATPKTVSAYLVHRFKTHAPVTLRRRLAAIRLAHQIARVAIPTDDPEVQTTLRGAKRLHGRPARQAVAIRLPEVRRLVATCGDDTAGKRDRALLLLGFAGALRRSEIAALDVTDVAHKPDGLRIRIRRSKTDQDAEGAEIGIPRGQHRATCPVHALEAWLAVLEHRVGPLFRAVHQTGALGRERMNPASIRFVLLARARKAGLPVDGLKRLTAHGLRAGFITEAYDRGLRDRDIMGHSRHKDVKTMHGYVRLARLLTDSPAGKVGL
ncbi:tyrosine-type recombinase/integrase (plasmid) [Roseomonas mucosa]|uniref:tyrosine-type recombinase/integrase n=1 Tax=Roseomonas mucosa TaxID=207340 RepID=UPI0030D11D49